MVQPSRNPSCSNALKLYACMGLGSRGFARRYSRDLG